MPIDKDDRKTGWTVQQGALSEVDPEVLDPGMAYHRSQLPDPDVAKAAGFATQPEPQKVYDDVDEALADPNGPVKEELNWAEIKTKAEDVATKVEDKAKDVLSEVENVVTDVENALGGNSNDVTPAEDVNTNPVPADEKPADAEPAPAAPEAPAAS